MPVTSFKSTDIEADYERMKAAGVVFRKPPTAAGPVTLAMFEVARGNEDYHVLWTHDFRGNDDQGDPDEMAYRQVLRSYLVALTERVRAYDRTGTFPVYIIMLDEWFYQVRNGRWWMNVLENPTSHRLRLGGAFRAWEDSIAAAQAQLREAIAGSTLLQAQRRQFGEEWLRNLVKVHVNITNPADPSFWSWKVVAGVPLADNMLRDHRKLVFYDATEADPYREALYTGAGVVRTTPTFRGKTGHCSCADRPSSGSRPRCGT